MTFLREKKWKKKNEKEAGMHEGENMAVLGTFRCWKKMKFDIIFSSDVRVLAGLFIYLFIYCSKWNYFAFLVVTK